MDLPQADDADPASVFTAPLGVPFQTHPDKAALLAAGKPIGASMPLMMLKNGATEVSSNANVVSCLISKNVRRRTFAVRKDSPQPSNRL